MQALLERDAELTALAAQLDAARAGRGAYAVVEGPAGIGKTSLLAAATELARERDMTVLRARGAPLEQSFSFGTARQLLEPVRARCRSAEWQALSAGAAGLAARRSRRHRRTAGPEKTPLTPPCTGFSGLWRTCPHSGLRWLSWTTCTGPTRRRCAGLAPGAAAGWATAAAGRRRPLRRARQRPPAAGRSARRQRRAAATTAATRPRSRSDGCARAVRGRCDEGFCDACHAGTGGNPFLLRALVASLRAEGVAPRRETAPAIESFGPEAVARAVPHEDLRVG